MVWGVGNELRGNGLRNRVVWAAYFWTKRGRIMCITARRAKKRSTITLSCRRFITRTKSHLSHSCLFSSFLAWYRSHFLMEVFRNFKRLNFSRLLLLPWTFWSPFCIVSGLKSEFCQTMTLGKSLWEKVRN